MLVVMQMFFDWLDGDSDLRGPVTWNTLIQCLNKLDLKDGVAETVESIFNQVSGTTIMGTNQCAQICLL